MKDEKGITLIVLVITIIILLVLIVVGVKTGTENISKVDLKSFYTKLEIVQEAVEKIADTDEFYVDSLGNKVFLKNLGSALTEEQISLITSISENYDTSKFRYFTADEINSILNISGIDLNLFIDFENKIVISADGKEIEGTMYYTLESDKYKVQYQDKNTGNVNFTCEVKSYGLNSYKIIITPININNLKDGIIKYRKYNVDDYWKVANNNEIIVNELSTYDIMYTDANNNYIIKTITIEKDEYQNIIIGD